MKHRHDEPGDVFLAVFFVQFCGLLLAALSWGGALLWTHGEGHELAVSAWGLQAIPWLGTIFYGLWRYREVHHDLEV